MTSDTKTPNKDQLEKHIATLVQIREAMLQHFGEQKGFTDALIDLEAKANPDLRKSALMPLAWGAESIVIPFGLLQGLGADLAGEVPDYGVVQAAFKDPESFLFSMSLPSVVEDSTKLAQLEQLVELVAVPLADTLTKPGPAGVAPYAERDVLDLHMWRLAALIDLDELFFLGDQPPSEAIRKEQAKVHEACIFAIVNSLGDIDRISNYDWPGSCNLHGWYADPATMASLDKLIDKAEDGHRLPLSMLDFTPADTSPEHWGPVLEKLTSHQAVVETTLVTTRAVCSVLPVAKDVFQNWLDAQTGPGATKNEKKLRMFVKKILDMFSGIEDKVFRDPAFGRFLLNRFIDVAGAGTVSLEHYDQFVHLVGILGFALSKGYLAGDGDKHELRPDLARDGYRDRNDVIQRIMAILKGSFGDQLCDVSSEFNLQETWFVTTDDLTVLFEDDDEGTPKVWATPAERVEKLPTAARFRFGAGLPLIIKALSNLAFETLRDFLTSHAHGDWKAKAESGLPTWLDDVLSTNEKLVDAMLKMLYPNADGWCVFEGGRDLNATASTVDALSMWCGVLLCRAALEGELEEKTPLRPLQPDPDYEIFQNFLTLLRRHTGSKPSGLPDSTVEPPEPQLAEYDDWLTVVYRVVHATYSWPLGDYDWATRLKKPASVADPRGPDAPGPPSFAEIVQIVSLVQHVRARCGQDRDQTLMAIIEWLDAHMRNWPGGNQFSGVFKPLLKFLGEKYPKAFEARSV